MTVSRSCLVLVLFSLLGCGGTNPTPTPPADSGTAPDRGNPDGHPSALPKADEFLTLPAPKGQTFWGAALSPDGTALATQLSDTDLPNKPVEPAPLQLRDATSGQVRRDLTAAKWSGFRVRFSPDGKTLVGVGRSGRVAFWDTQTWGDPVVVIPNNEAPGSAEDLRFSPDSSLLLVQASGSFKIVYDVAKRTRKTSFPPRAALAAEFSADGKSLFIPQSKVELQAITVETDTLVATLPFGGTVAVSPDGRLISVARRLIDWREGKVVRELDLPPPKSDVPGVVAWADGYPDAAAFSPDGKLLATAGSGYGDVVVRMWDVSTGKLAQSLPLPDTRRVRSLEFSLTGNRLLAVTDTHVRVWKLNGK